ncbi:MAG: SPOR domain-containing protein [Salinisphaeraceae bacterium]|jgi:cell division septation protein DedD|nr:SPOR domain-containing protein [Salinisphaeraceae bacterium]
MARDYSNRPSDNRKTKTRRKPAARPARKSAAGAGVPGWVYLFCGLCLGLVVAAGVYIFARPASTTGTQIEIAGMPALGAPDAAESPATPAPPKEEEPRFAFYEMLPNYEVVIPEEEYTEPARSPSSPDTASKPAQQASQTTMPKVEQPGRYVIQAGSFSSRADAERRKAGLALLGLQADIERVELSGGKTVFRVRSGPLNDVATLNKMLRRLKDEGIDTLVMRHKG